jgi:hypothetical protein
MNQIFGHFIENLPAREEYLSIGFSPSHLPLKKRWQNNGLSADFIADYFKVFFVSRQEEEEGLETEIMTENLCNAVKYIANELLENAMKFQDASVPFTAKIGFSLYDDRLIFCVTNGLQKSQVEYLQKFINRILSEEPEDLYVQAMRANAKKGSDEPSQLGLLSMICDYSAKLGWKFETLATNPPVITVSTMVCLDI